MDNLLNAFHVMSCMIDCFDSINGIAELETLSVLRSIQDLSLCLTVMQFYLEIFRSQLMDLELQRDNIQHEIKEIRNCLTRQKQEAKQVVEVEKKNELKVLELSIEKDQLHSEVESLRSQLKQAEGNFAREKQSQLEKIRALQDQLHEDQRGSKENVEKLKQVSN